MPPHHLIYTCVYTCVVVFEFSRCPAAALLHFPNYRCPVRTRATLDANNIKNHHNIEKHGRHRTRGVNALPVRNPLLWWPSMLHLPANNPRQPCRVSIRAAIATTRRLTSAKLRGGSPHQCFSLYAITIAADRVLPCSHTAT